MKTKNDDKGGWGGGEEGQRDGEIG